METGCLLDYRGDAFFHGSLAEPISCVTGAFHACYHTKAGSYVHHMGIVEGGNLAILAGAGPMGLGAIDYAIHCDRRPGLLVVTDINGERLDRAASLYTPEEAARNGVRLVYMNTAAVPAGAVTSAGCSVIVSRLPIVSAAESLVAVPFAPVTTQRKRRPS